MPCALAPPCRARRVSQGISIHMFTALGRDAKTSISNKQNPSSLHLHSKGEGVTTQPTESSHSRGAERGDEDTGVLLSWHQPDPQSLDIKSSAGNFIPTRSLPLSYFYFAVYCSSLPRSPLGHTLPLKERFHDIHLLFTPCQVPVILTRRATGSTPPQGRSALHRLLVYRRRVVHRIVKRVCVRRAESCRDPRSITFKHRQSPVTPVGLDSFRTLGSPYVDENAHITYCFSR